MLQLLIGFVAGVLLSLCWILWSSMTKHTHSWTTWKLHDTYTKDTWQSRECRICGFTEGKTI